MFRSSYWDTLHISFSFFLLLNIFLTSFFACLYKVGTRFFVCFIIRYIHGALFSCFPFAICSRFLPYLIHRYHCCPTFFLFFFFFISYFHLTFCSQTIHWSPLGAYCIMFVSCDVTFPALVLVLWTFYIKSKKCIVPIGPRRTIIFFVECSISI